MSKCNKYHEKFLDSFTAENVVALFSRYKGSSKEITESWGMLEAVKKIKPLYDNTLIVVVGDGASPRTGSIMAYYTRAEVVSIDPCINLDHWYDHCQKQKGMGFPVNRLKVIKDKIENILIDCSGKDCIVIFPHSHANMRDVFIDDYNKISYISMPCCNPIPSMFNRILHKVYEDEHIISPKNIIHIWNDSDELVRLIEKCKSSVGKNDIRRLIEF